MRFGLVAAYDLTRYYSVCWVFMLLLCLLYVVMIAVFQPYKDKKYCQIDALLFLALSLWTFSLLTTVGFDYGYFLPSGI